jgi:glutathione peroxidase
MTHFKLFAWAVPVLAMAASTVYDFSPASIEGKPTSLSEYKGKVLLLVNVASQCGYTPQYAGLEKIYEKYKDRGLVVLGFPANNFGEQEPGSNAEIKSFCTRNYHVTFPMFAKISVQGDNKAPLYQYLTAQQGEIGWNFTKFLVDRSGKVLQKYDSSVEPESPELLKAIEAALR